MDQKVHGQEVLGQPVTDLSNAELLEQMAEEIPGVRPAVISAETKTVLNNYRTFRHLARNIYTFNLDLRKLRQLVDDLPNAVDLFCKDLSVFLDFLKKWGTYKK